MTANIETKPKFDLTPKTEAQRVALARLHPHRPLDVHTSYDDPTYETIDCIKVITGLNQENAEQLERILRHCVEQIQYDIEEDDMLMVRYQIYHHFNEQLSAESCRFDQKGQLSKLAMSLEMLSTYLQGEAASINRELSEFILNIDEIGTMTLLQENAHDIYI